MGCVLLFFASGIVPAQGHFEIRELSRRDLICVDGSPVRNLKGKNTIIFDPRSALIISLDKKSLKGPGENWKPVSVTALRDIKKALDSVRGYLELSDAQRKDPTKSQDIKKAAEGSPKLVVDVFTSLGIVPDESLLSRADSFEQITEILLSELILRIGQTVPVYQVKGSVTQSREYRYGRSYPSSAFTALTVTDEDKKGLEAIRELKLKEAARSAYDQARADLKSAWKEKVGDKLSLIQQSSSGLTDEAKILVTTLTVTGEKLSLSSFANESEYKTLTDDFERARATLAAIRDLSNEIKVNLNSIGTGLKDFEKTDLPTRVIGLLKYYGLVSRVDAIANEQFTAVLSLDDAIAIGNTVTSLGTNWSKSGLKVQSALALDVSTNDELSITVVGTPGSLVDGKFVSSASAWEAETFEAGAFAIGNAITRTYALSYLFPGPGQTGSAAPSLNIHWKKYGRGRSLASNRSGSVGFGFSIFPLSVDQNKSGINQTFGGPSLSFFDDWLTLGYGRNFSLGTWSPFVGIAIPFRLGG